MKRQALRWGIASILVAVGGGVLFTWIRGADWADGRKPFRFVCDPNKGWHVVVFAATRSGRSLKRGEDVVVVDFAEDDDGVVFADVELREGWAEDKFVFRDDEAAVPVTAHGYHIFGDSIVALDVAESIVSCRVFFVGLAPPAQEWDTEVLRALLAD